MGMIKMQNPLKKCEKKGEKKGKESCFEDRAGRKPKRWAPLCCFQMDRGAEEARRKIDRQSVKLDNSSSRKSERRVFGECCPADKNSDFFLG